MSFRLHILLPVHNRRATTVRFVATLAEQTWRGFHLLLIDDGSTDGTADAVKKLWPATTTLCGSGNWWWAGALDEGCRHLKRSGIANDDVLLLINDDVEIDADFLARAMTEIRPLRNTLVLARQVDAVTGHEIDNGGGVRADLARLRFTAARNPQEINCLPTRGLFLRWGDMCRIGGFRPKWLPHYMSDYEFTLRAVRQGLHLRVARNAVLRVHTEQTGHSLEKLFHQRRFDRFRFLFSRRYKDNPVTWSIFVWLAVHPARRPFLWLKIWVFFLITTIRFLYIPIDRRCLPPAPRSQS